MNLAPEITFDLKNRIALIGIDRANKRNALRQDMFETIGHYVREAETHADVGVLYANGANFSAGLDLSEHKERTPFDTFDDSRRQGEIMNTIENGRIPWISALSGATIGAGFELAASTHIRVGDEAMYLALPEGRRGIFVGGGGSVRIARIIGVEMMTDMMLTGRVIEAKDAQQIRAIQYLVPTGQAYSKALELAATIAENSPQTNRAVIGALPRIRDMARDDGLYVESLMAALIQASPEAMEGLDEFLEKRAKPLR